MGSGGAPLALVAGWLLAPLESLFKPGGPFFALGAGSGGGEGIAQTAHQKRGNSDQTAKDSTNKHKDK